MDYEADSTCTAALMEWVNINESSTNFGHALSGCDIVLYLFGHVKGVALKLQFMKTGQKRFTRHDNNNTEGDSGKILSIL